MATVETGQDQDRFPVTSGGRFASWRTFRPPLDPGTRVELLRDVRDGQGDRIVAPAGSTGVVWHSRNYISGALDRLRDGSPVAVRFEGQRRQTVGDQRFLRLLSPPPFEPPEEPGDAKGSEQPEEPTFTHGGDHGDGFPD